MKKTQQDYLFSKMGGEAIKAKAAFSKAHPTAWDQEELTARLTRAGFIVGDGYYALRGVSIPQTEGMKANEVAIKDFTAKVDAALANAKDEVYLGGTDALALLRNFQAALQELV